MTYLSALNKRNSLFWLGVGMLLVFLLGVVDFLTGYELSFSLFYLAPITLVAWYAGRGPGVMISLLSAAMWITADYASGNRLSIPAFYYWNTFIRLGFFITVTLLITALRRALRIEQELTRTDYLTGAISVRYFYELAQSELSRHQRYQRHLTLVYLDLDNFKQINDQHGHSTGDHVLRHIAVTIRTHIRSTDTIARLGGDEFALLFPETGQAESQVIIDRLWQCLMAEMEKNHWPVSFSIGVVTFTEAPATVDDMVRITDACMYAVKTNGKNRIQYQVYPPSQPELQPSSQSPL